MSSISKETWREETSKQLNIIKASSKDYGNMLK